MKAKHFVLLLFQRDCVSMFVVNCKGTGGEDSHTGSGKKIVPNEAKCVPTYPLTYLGTVPVCTPMYYWGMCGVEVLGVWFGRT